MEWDLIIMLSIMFGVATYLILGKRLSNVVLGVMIFSNAINLLLILTSGNPDHKTVPILEEGGNGLLVDPLPQALALTAIVIGFGLLSFFLVMICKFYQSDGSENLDVLFRREH